ncbi:plasmid transfer protein TraA [Streptomyces marincola]|uniref:Uncharacterized protein n=1 Tax=Streptomyces marincola TaxID=2878388 RepID=A0A1W7CZK2_9ACTN|nr:plasmid transfer protein TraA [Streptomyces marincola]ARQ69740.1 hypothetical protein CAG99_13475 [Streptomyces marincola]
MPTQAPAAPAAGVRERVQRRAAEQVDAFRRRQAAEPFGPPPSSRAERSRARRERTVQRSRSTHRERTKNRTVNININKSGGAASAGSAAGQRSDTAQGTPGANFMSNEDVRAFSEYVRKTARNRAVERSMDAEHLTQVLRHIPTADGSTAGARMRARRVARHLRAIAAAEKVIAKQAAALYGSFEREFESDLRKVGKARPAKQPRAPFSFE